MTTTDKLAEALTLGLECAYELLAEKRQALAGHPEKVAPYQEMVDYLRRELAAHEQAQAAPLKERPDFIAGYYAGLADGRRCAERDAAEQAQAERVGLTDSKIDDLSHEMVKGGKSVNWLARAIEAAHGIGATIGEQHAG